MPLPSLANSRLSKRDVECCSCRRTMTVKAAGLLLVSLFVIGLLGYGLRHQRKINAEGIGGSPCGAIRAGLLESASGP